MHTTVNLTNNNHALLELLCANYNEIIKTDISQIIIKHTFIVILISQIFELLHYIRIAYKSASLYRNNNYE